VEIITTTFYAVVYHPPGSYSDFLSEFSEFLSQLVLSTDTLIAVTKFKEIISNIIFFTDMCNNKGQLPNISPAKLDYFVDHYNFNAYAIGQCCPPEKEGNQSEEAGYWYNLQLRDLKETVTKL